LLNSQAIPLLAVGPSCRAVSYSSTGQLALITPRLEIRPPEESDRACSVDLSCDEAFMIFSAGVYDTTSANTRFDATLAFAGEVPFAKQP